MAKTTHSSHCDMMIADLLHDLELKADEAERCQEMLARLNCYDRNSKLPVEIIDYVGNYAQIEIVSKEGFVTEASAILKKALDALMVAIKWIIEKLTEIFKYLFNSEYRACRDALDLQRRFITMSINQTKVNTFENTMCNVITREDIDSIIFKTQKLVELIRNSANMSRQDFVNTLLKSYCDESGVVFDPTTFRVNDNLPNPTPMAGTTFAKSGWTVAGIIEVIGSYLAMLRGIESLKANSKATQDAASDLKKRAMEAASNGAAAKDITELQRECSTKINSTKIIGYAIAVCCRRSENILAFINQLYHSTQGQ